MHYKSTFRIFLIVIGIITSVSVASAVDAGYYAPSSLLANGRWVKIRVNESGIQQITHEQLRQWGFNDPSAVTVFGFGGVAGVPEIMDASIPDDLPRQPVVYRDDRLLFYGESNHRINAVYFSAKSPTQPICPGIERNNVADAGYYFITDSQPVYQPEEIPFKKSNTLTVKRHHWEAAYIEEEDNNPVRFGQLYFGPDFSESTDEVSYSFPIVDMYYDSSATSYTTTAFHNIVVGIGSSPYLQLSYPHRNDIIAKEIKLTASSAHNMMGTNATFTNCFLAPQLPHNSTSFDVKLSKLEGSNFTYAAIERFVFAYPQYNNMGDRKSMLMCENTIAAQQPIEFAKTDRDLLVWNVDEGYNVRPYETIYSISKNTITVTTDKSYNILSHLDRALRIIAFDPSQDHLPVEYAGEVANQNLHSYQVPDLVILSADAFVDDAERLAALHRDLLGQDVLVLRQDEIFNEFSSGTPSLWGIRRAMKMFYDRDPAKFKHLLLFGASSYDNRGFTPGASSYRERGALLLNYGTPYYNTMEKITTAYSCDGYFGMLCDTPPADEFIHSIQDINVGRIPVSDGLQASKAVDKVHEYLTYSPTSDIYQRVLLVADHGNALSHMTSAEKTGASFLANNPGMTLIKGYSNLYALDNTGAGLCREMVVEALKRGVLYFNYTGHGKSDAIGSSFIYDISKVRNTNYSYYPMAMLASCNTYTFDRMSESLAQEMVLKSNGGMIGVVAACREVYQSRNEVLSETMADVFTKSKPGVTTGDILRISRNELLRTKWANDPGLMINTACYNLCGDPAIPLFFPANKIVIENVNGNAYSDGEGNLAILPLATNTITGYVEDNDNPGSPLAGFNGKIIFSLYESPENRDVVTFGKDDKAASVYVDENLLIETTCMVTDGKFTVTFTPPMPVRKGAFNRATVTAVLPDNSVVATTYTKSLLCDVDDVPATPDDTEAPEITELYIDSPGFVSGDMTAENFTVYATVIDTGSGIYGPTGTVGPGCRISVDNTMNYPVVGTQLNNNGDGSYNIEYPFTALSDGRHSLTLHISDNAGNSASRSIDFIINNSASNPRLSVAETPARVQATIDMAHNFTAAPSGQLIVEDEAGNTVFSRSDVSFPFEWDLTDGKGNLVADGVYRAYAICKGGTLYGSTPKIDIIVLQKQ